MWIFCGSLAALEQFFSDPIAIRGFIHPDSMNIFFVSVDNIVGSELESHVCCQVCHQVVDAQAIHDKEAI